MGILFNLKIKEPNMKTKILFLSLLFVFCTTLAQAADRYVVAGTVDSGDCLTSAPPTCGTIAYAITQAADGDTIVLSAGTFELDTVVTIDKELTIVGAGSDATTISSDEAVLDDLIAIIIMAGTPTVTIQDLALTNLSGDLLRCITHNGTVEVGAVTIDLVIDNVNFTGCSQESGGGVLFSSSGNLTITNATFTDNFANDALAGALLVEFSGDVVIEDSSFSGSIAGEQGAAIYANSLTSLSVSNTTDCGFKCGHRSWRCCCFD